MFNLKSAIFYIFIRDHEERNEQRKLSKDEKKAKKAKKLKEDTSLGVNVAVYR